MSKDKLIPELRFPEFQNEGEWIETSLGEIGDFIGGGTPDTTKPEYWNGDILWYTPTEVKEGKVGKSNRTITEEGLKNSSAKLLPKGSLLLTTRATIGDIAIADSECTTNQGFQSLVVNETEVNSFWYYWIIQHKNELIKKASGSTFPEIGKNEITKIKAFKPIKLEQQKIASCLSSLDNLIAFHIQKLELLKDHKKGLMQNLFPQEGEKVPKYRFKEFEKDGVWVENVLGEICDVRDGTHDSPKYVSNGYPMITSKNLLTNGLIDFENITYIKEEDYININKRSKVDINDILFGMIGTIGNPVIVKTDGFAIKNVALIKSIGKLNQEFLLHQLKSNYILNQFDKVNAGGILKFIALGVIRSLAVIVPSDQEQQKIASCLSSLDALITAQAEKIEQLKLYKKGLMQGLFPKIND